MNLYRNEEASLSSSFFMNPPCEYRGAPFWAWNCEITKDKLDEQIETFRRMGMGGYHIHVRTGSSDALPFRRIYGACKILPA